MKLVAVMMVGLGTSIAMGQAAAPASAPATTPAPAVTVPLVKMPPVPDELSTPTERTIAGLQARVLDFANLGRYREENAKLAPPAAGEKRVVFFGDSITDNWGRKAGKFFPGKPYVNRGISGQTSFQLLLRFRQDVVALKPALVVILPGTNDIAGNTGPENMQMIQDNIISMVQLARANNIKVVLSSTLPSKTFGWNPEVKPAESIKALNKWMEDYCAKEKIVFLNYYPAMVDSEGGIKEELAADKVVHPNDAGYAVMEPLAQAAVDKVLKQ